MPDMFEAEPLERCPSAKQIPGLPSYVGLAMGGDPNGTHRLSAIEINYAELVACFGEPNGAPCRKTDAEWIMTFTLFGFSPGYVATIYNYKTGKNYLGSEGLSVENIRHWHIGGREADVVGYICSMLLNRRGAE